MRLLLLQILRLEIGILDLSERSRIAYHKKLPLER